MPHRQGFGGPKLQSIRWIDCSLGQHRQCVGFIPFQPLAEFDPQVQFKRAVNPADPFVVPWRECHELCVWPLAHAGFGHAQALKRSANMISNWLRAANHSRMFLPPFGSVAQIARDFLRDSKVFVGFHEQTHTPDLPHDELALLSSH